jgi:hypothetical protein
MTSVCRNPIKRVPWSQPLDNHGTNIRLTMFYSETVTREPWILQAAVLVLMYKEVLN